MTEPVWLDSPAMQLPPGRMAWGPDSPAPGLLAVGGELSHARLAEAYGHGIFPWFGPDEPPLWWSPDPRMVLDVADFRLHPSLRKTLRRFARTPRCEIRIDHDRRGVIEACSQAPRAGQSGTWIVPAMVEAYSGWPAVHSVETWIDGERAGGLYAVAIGAMLFGESMFARRPDASKIALAALVAMARRHGVARIDCQQQTRHLASLGARPVSRAAFEAQLAGAVSRDAGWRWTYDRDDWVWLDAAIVAPRGPNVPDDAAGLTLPSKLATP